MDKRLRKLGLEDANGSQQGHVASRGQAGAVSHGISQEEESWFVGDIAQHLPQYAHKHIPTAAKTVIAYVTSLGGDGDVLRLPNNARLAAAIAGDLAQAEGRPRATAPRPTYDASELLTTERVAALAERRVLEIRRELFQSDDAPFARWEEARAWIAEEAARPFDRTVWDAEHTRIDAWIEREVRRLVAAGSPYDYRLNLAWDFTIVYLRDDRGQRALFPTMPSEKLRKLARAQDKIAGDFGWLPEEATLFILLGVPPVEPRYRLRRHSQLTRLGPDEGWLGSDWVQVDIHDRFFTYEDLRDLFRNITATGFLRTRKSIAQLEKLQRLWRFVRDRRPDDWRGIVRRKMPWKRVHEEWNAANPRDAYRSLRGLLKAYKEARAYMG